MLISIKHNFVFLCTPKCASNSIESKLLPFSDISISGPPYFRHTNYRRYRQFIRPFLVEMTGRDGFETICILREPLSWLYSHYRFRSRLEIRNPSHPSFVKCTYGIGFGDFIASFMADDPPPYAAVRSQFDFIKNDANDAGVDRIFLYERLEDFVNYMSQKVRRKLRLNYRNMSPRTGTEARLSALSDYARRKIGSRFKGRRPVDAAEAEYQLPDELLAGLRHFLARDFGIYERLKNSRQ